MTDQELLAALEDCTLPQEQWDHQGHVRVAWMYVTQHDLETAVAKMRGSLQAYNALANVPEAIDRGYHETITLAFMRVIAAADRETGPHATAADFCQQHPELLDKKALLRFYSRDRIMSWEAKREFIEPDLEPLPE